MILKLSKEKLPSKGYSFSYTRWPGPTDVLHSIAPVVNNAKLYILKPPKRIDFIVHSHHKMQWK